MSRKPPRLTEKQMNDICEMLGTGASRPTAAQFAGCHPATLRAEMRRNRPFSRRVIQAELKLEAQMLRTIRAAAAEPKHWRAAGWVLERIYTNRYGKRRSHTLTLNQVHELVSEVTEIVASELPVRKFRQRIFHRLALLTTTVEKSVDTEPTAEIIDVPASQPADQRRLDGGTVLADARDGDGEGEIPPEQSGESTETTADGP